MARTTSDTVYAAADPLGGTPLTTPELQRKHPTGTPYELGKRQEAPDYIQAMPHRDGEGLPLVVVPGPCACAPCSVCALQ